MEQGVVEEKATRIMEILLATVPVADQLPADLEEALSPLSVLGDEELWRAARSRLAPEESAELEGLHQKREREGQPQQTGEVRLTQPLRLTL